MFAFLQNAAAFIVAISILVAIHEFGHFWVARKLGVKVLRYSIGFGKPLFKRIGKKDQTEYVIAMLPLGGYVKMLDEHEGEVAEAEKHRAFNRQSLGVRTAVVFAGPLANFLLAIFLYACISAFNTEDRFPVLGEVITDSIAAQAGLKAGDEIVGINGRKNRGWSENRLYVLNEALKGDAIVLEVVSDGVQSERVLDLGNISPAMLTLPAATAIFERGLGMLPKIPLIPPVVAKVSKDSPAALAELRSGDKILAVNGVPTPDRRTAIMAISQRPNLSTEIEIERDSESLILKITPANFEQDGRVIGRIGVSMQAGELPEDWVTSYRDGLADSLITGVHKTWVMSSLTVRMLVNMVLLKESVENISGPITIARVAGETAKTSVSVFLGFLAVVSISLGILNLLPIPMLDGGHLLYYFIEFVKGSPPSERVMVWGQQFGIVVLAGLMSLAFYNDIIRLLG